MREAGLVVAHTLRVLAEAVRPGISTADLDAIAEREIRVAGAVPSFLGYYGYPATICTSVNEEIVHGIPSEKRRLNPGDIISIDCGAIVDGWHGDAALSVGVGEIDPADQALLDACEAALWQGIAQAVPGHRLSDISHAVEDRSARPASTVSSASTPGTASAPRCTWSPRSRTTARPAKARGCAPGWRWRSSR